MILHHEDIVQLETRYRANFINSLGGFKSLVLVGTRSPEGNDNLTAFSSLFHLGANPALCGVVVRPNEPKQNTLGNILNTQSYTLNHVLPSFYEQAHQTSAKYEEGLSEFGEVGLTPEFHAGIYAPFVQESAVKFACEFVQKIDIELNGTFLVIGKIVKIIVPDNCLYADGFVDLEKAQTVTCSGLDSYHSTQRLSRLSYAKVGKAPARIEQ
ncbi:MAG: flavin reductase [Spirosomaceae bacterium]|jgi:flavin reductase (DIM6/NTAB) family NADH-FMN oxidoreductase RutF|nr:flavin reductase [Spirosomataceae bacterium]